MKLYAKLAPWFHLVTPPESYGDEAAYIVRLVEAARIGPAQRLLELGSGGGNMASHLKRRFSCTLTDLSQDMLEVSRALNPACEHIQGDMRSLRLGRLFDVVLAQDAIGYMLTEDDLRAALATAAAHVRPGGMVVLIPDTIAETFAAGTRHGGHDGTDGRRLRYLEWTHDLPPGGSVCDVDYVFLMREPGRPTAVERDRHSFGVFARARWEALIKEAGLRLVKIDVVDPCADQHVVFVALRET